MIRKMFLRRVSSTTCGANQMSEMFPELWQKTLKNQNDTRRGEGILSVFLNVENVLTKKKKRNSLKSDRFKQIINTPVMKNLPFFIARQFRSGHKMMVRFKQFCYVQLTARILFSPLGSNLPLLICLKFLFVIINIRNK